MGVIETNVRFYIGGRVAGHGFQDKRLKKNELGMGVFKQTKKKRDQI